MYPWARLVPVVAMGFEKITKLILYGRINGTLNFALCIFTIIFLSIEHLLKGYGLLFLPNKHSFVPEKYENSPTTADDR